MTQSGPFDRPSRPPKPTSKTSSWTKPRPADLILYEFLWRNEANRGEEVGRKTRPCLILATYERAGQLRVITAPLTTRDYNLPGTVMLPRRVAEGVGLDLRARIVWTELNEFTWVGPDVRTSKGGTPCVGVLPEKIWRAVLNKVIEAAVRPIHRSE